jgi:hypothetical protein
LLGGTCKQIRRDNNDDLSARLDARPWAPALNVARVVIEGVHTLVWSRSDGPKDD